MSARVLSKKEMKEIGSILPRTIAIDKVVMSYRPEIMASALGPDSLLPNVWIALIAAAHACQAAWYHLYLAYHDRFYYHNHRTPPKLLTGNALASWYFTSFTLHIIASENHLSSAIFLAAGGILEKKEHFKGIKSVANFVNENEIELGELISPLLHGQNETWDWIHEFRNRWVHRDPMRIEELGKQWKVSSQQRFWTHDVDNHRYCYSIKTGDPDDTDVTIMLEKGRQGFHYFAIKYAAIVLYFEEHVRNRWNKWKHENRLTNRKMPRKRRLPKELLGGEII